MTDPFRCAAASATRGDALPGTASSVRAFLLVENPGPWGVDALRDSRLPGQVKAGLAASARAAGVRVLLVRRHRRPRRPAGITVFAARVDAEPSWVERAVVDGPADLLDLDLAALGEGRSPGLDRWDDTLFCVCTHGRHDACCAERGRPVAAALAGAHPERTWEVSHIGGDRFAANMLVLPHGLYYGRLDETSAVSVARAHLAGRVDLGYLRGRTTLPMPAQAAEAALRERLGELRLDGVRAVSVRSGGDRTTTRFEVGGVRYDVVVRSTQGADRHRLTCTAARLNPVPTYEAVALERVP